MLAASVVAVDDDDGGRSENDNQTEGRRSTRRKRQMTAAEEVTLARVSGRDHGLLLHSLHCRHLRPSCPNLPAENGRREQERKRGKTSVKREERTVGTA